MELLNLKKMITVKKYKTQQDYYKDRDILPVNSICYVEETKRMYYQSNYE